MNEADKMREETSHMLKNVEEQVGDLVKTLEEQDMQVWAYLIGGVVALLVGLLAAYLYSQMVRERRKSTLERIKDVLRGGVSR